VKESIRAGLTLALLAGALQVVFLGAALFGGAFSYMGGVDLRALRVAWTSYSGDIVRLVAELYALDLIVLLALALPFLPWVVVWSRTSRRRALIATTLLIVALHLSWIAVAAIRIPTLFSDIYWQDGTPLSARVMGFVCSTEGAVALALAWLAALGAMARTAGWRPAAVAGLVLGGAALWLARVETRAPDVELPPKSVVLLFADSLRYDVPTPAHMPAVAALMRDLRATVVPRVVPPLPRTAPALNALFTGKLPEESGVTTMFSPEATFRQTPSVASLYKKAGFCTIAVGEYPAELMRKLDYGFEINDTPLVRFREITLQLVLAKDPFALATLTFAGLRAHAPADLGNLLAGLPTFADSRALLRRFGELTRRCGGRPVFAFVFADQPHFPYVQTWPHYLGLDGAYAGRYRYVKDAVSTPASDADRRRIRALYDSAVRAVDATFADFISGQSRAGALKTATIIVSGDHGESLYDRLGIMGHGDQLGELEGIAVPWIVFGAGRPSFNVPGELVQSVRLTPKLLELNHVDAAPVTPTLAPELVVLETDAWLADTPNVPKERVRYPELSELLTIHDRDAHIVLKPEYRAVVEYAKQRVFILGADRYAVTPLPDRIAWTKNGAPVAPGDLPTPITAHLERYLASLALILTR
jgi:hypothetical protein